MAAMAAASLHSHLSRPNPNSGFSDLFPPMHCNYVLARGGAYSSAQRCAVASGSVARLLHLSVQRDIGKNFYLRIAKRRLPRILPFSVGGEDSKQSDAELDGLQGGIGSEKKDPEESWEQLLESFKQQSRKMQSLVTLLKHKNPQVPTRFTPRMIIRYIPHVGSSPSAT